MKRPLFVLLLSSAVVLSSCETLNQTAQVLSQSMGNPTSSEIASGIKEALQLGTSASAERLNAQNGFLGNAAVKLLFPPEAQKVEKALRSLGLNQLCDNVITSLNRAAEDAVIEAKPIFISAIKQMTISDASSILLGKQSDAATQYFQRVTNDQLSAKFKPIIQSSLAKVGATRNWTEVVSRYNQIPLVTDINPDLTGYVTQKAIDGLFMEIAKEELKIRQNVSSRNSILLQKVFGYADRQK
ncbi:DUF4197 domain-containing protein [Arcticibacter sp.]|uniref:DUF4197 domain-containing protein n=1 Tax=Arcticibacter sp. TaxID=1872630 RepID=UPI0038902BC3